MKLYVKYMVSIRCKMLVEAAFKKIGLHYCKLELGMVETTESITPAQREALKVILAESSLELMDDTKAILIEKIKNVVVEMIHYMDEPPLTNFSDYIAEKLYHDYTYMANVFSEVTGTTIGILSYSIK